MKVLVFNGWAAGLEAWDLCTFPHDWVFSYLEELDGVPEQVMAETDEAVIVGFSMGGSMALKTVLRHPEKVRGLVLVSAAARMMEAKVEGWAGLSERRLSAFRLGTELLFGTDPSPLYKEKNLVRGVDFLAETDLRAELTALADRGTSFPVRIIASERDGIVRPNNAMFLQGIFPQAKLTLVPGTEHALPISAPEQVDRAVFEVLKEAGYDAEVE